MERLDKIVGKVLREIRQEKGLTATRVAKDSGLSRRFLEYVETGTKSLSVRTLFRLCEALGVRPSKMIQRIELLQAVHKQRRDNRNDA